MPSKTQMERSLTEIVRQQYDIPVRESSGSVYYVSSVTGASGNSGKTPRSPKATINQAYDLCTANQGDIIYVMENHAETISAATSLVMDTAGISIIGLGKGTDRPTLELSAAASNVPITGANNVLKNIVFDSTTTSAISIGVTITGTNTLIEDCEFNQTTANCHVIESIRIGAANNDASGSTIRNCKFYNIDADHENDIAIYKDQVGLTIEGNWCQGNYNVGTLKGAIAADSAENMTNVLVKDNLVISAAADQAIAINLDGPTNTGLLIGNYASAPDADWTPFIAIGCGFHENYQAGALASQGVLYPNAFA
jgi:hypothetical protein